MRGRQCAGRALDRRGEGGCSGRTRSRRRSGHRGLGSRRVRDLLQLLRSPWRSLASFLRPGSPLGCGLLGDGMDSGRSRRRSRFRRGLVGRRRSGHSGRRLVCSSRNRAGQAEVLQLARTDAVSRGAAAAGGRRSILRGRSGRREQKPRCQNCNAKAPGAPHLLPPKVRESRRFPAARQAHARRTGLIQALPG